MDHGEARSLKALITGISGQDGAYLARLLLEKGYQVFGSYRRSSSAQTGRLAELGIANDVQPVSMELLEASNLANTIGDVQPDELYNLAGQSFVGSSFDQSLYTGDVDALGVTRLLEAIRHHSPQTRFYQASSSELFGNVSTSPQSESTPFCPRNPYGVAKLYGHWMTVNYRQSLGLHASSGLLFNHESPLRGQEFVTRKITLSLAKIRHGQLDQLKLGNLDAERDWGYAGDYVEGMWQMLQQDVADDYVLAAGQKQSVRRFAELAAAAAGFDLEWEGEAQQTVGIDRKSSRTIISVDPKFYRPAESHILLGDPTKARTRLGWECRVAFEPLVEMMVESDLRKVASGLPYV